MTKGGQFFEYNEPGYEYKGIDIDGELAKSLADDLTNDQKSRDGITNDLFALTANRQQGFVFKLEGKENYRGRQVYHITFKPRKASLFDCDDDGECSCWAGEALIDLHRISTGTGYQLAGEGHSHGRPDPVGDQPQAPGLQGRV